jgi:glycerol-3-phosphate dehydrogenase
MRIHHKNPMRKIYDLAIVGGGINGAGIARDAAGRGLSVLLCEQDDLAQHTSSASTKLIHGGLRYLEYREFGLVRKALKEREVLLRSAPHIMWPMRFVMPHDEAMRPRWMIRAGLFLYDHLARRDMLPGSRAVDLRRHPAGGDLRPAYRSGFVYSDGWVDDARLVVVNALDAHERGATVLTRVRCTAANRLDADGTSPPMWRLSLEDRAPAGSAGRQRIEPAPSVAFARALVDAAGPWAGRLESGDAPAAGRRRLRLVKGSHIVVPALFSHPYAYLFQAEDRRVVFAIPYEGRFTLIGTTDVEFEGDPARVAIDDAEVAYLCACVSRYFERRVEPSDVVWTYAGVRPLLEDEASDASAVTRDYTLAVDSVGAPRLTVLGGKITTFRLLAEEAVERLLPLLRASAPSWTAGSPLPGGDLPAANFDDWLAGLGKRIGWLDPLVLRRLARGYGSRIDRVLGAACAPAELGTEVAPGLYEAELEYLRRNEWAMTADDVLWRRSKLGLHLDAAGRQRVADWFG